MDYFILQYLLVRFQTKEVFVKSVEEMEKSPLDAMWPLFMKMDSFYTALAKRHGESYLSEWLLDELFDAPDGVTQKYLCEAMHAPKQTVSSIIASLEKRGLVKTVPNENDKRSKLHMLTEAGMQKQQLVGRDMAKVETYAVEGLKPEELQTMYQTFQHIVDRLEDGLALLPGKEGAKTNEEGIA